MPARKKQLPIKHWSYSSLMTYLRNPLAWYKGYVEGIRDMPSGPAAAVGRAAHKALEHYYGGIGKDGAMALGLEYLRNVPDFEINFGKAATRKAQKERRRAMEREYAQAISFYLARPPRYRVVGIEVSALANVEGLPLPIKAVSDLVVQSKTDPDALDIVDHKFVNAFSPLGAGKTLFTVQALFNYYTVRERFGKPVKRFILQECKIRANRDGKSQMRRYVIEFEKLDEEFVLFHRLLSDATAHLMNTKLFLPNPSDLFDGENSFDLYRLGLIEN